MLDLVLCVFAVSYISTMYIIRFGALVKSSYYNWKCNFVCSYWLQTAIRYYVAFSLCFYKWCFCFLMILEISKYKKWMYIYSIDRTGIDVMIEIGYDLWYCILLTYNYCNSSINHEWLFILSYLLLSFFCLQLIPFFNVALGVCIGPCSFDLCYASSNP